MGRLRPRGPGQLWARSRAIYFPTGLESFGYPLAEARVNGQPVIARDTEQNREIAGPALCGYTVGDPDSLRHATEAALTAAGRPRPGALRPGRLLRLDAGTGLVTRQRKPPRLGVLDFNPIQYHAPLYQRLVQRGNVSLSVLYLHDQGYRPVLDPDFGVPVEWDIDLLSGYQHAFLATTGMTRAAWRRVGALARWVRAQDAVVIHGHSHPWMLLATLICRASRVPYLLRGDAGPRGSSAGWRRRLRDTVARIVVSGSAGGLAVGQLNEHFYRKFGAPRIIFAPHSVDDARFAAARRSAGPSCWRSGAWTAACRVLMFCGKLGPRKRPLDLAAAAARLDAGGIGPVRRGR